MKMEISTQEFMSFINGEEMVKVKEKIAGAILATVDSPELQEAIDKRVTKYAEERMKAVMDEAVKVSDSYYNKGQLTGWAAQIIREEFRNHFRRQHYFEDVLQKLIKEQLDILLKNGIEEFLKTEVKRVINEDLLKVYAEYVQSTNIESLIKKEIGRRLKNMLV